MHVTVATGLVALVGVSWSVAMWAPFAITNAEVAHIKLLAESCDIDGDRWADGQDQTAGILGIQNVAISIPQIIADGELTS